MPIFEEFKNVLKSLNQSLDFDSARIEQIFILKSYEKQDFFLRSGEYAHYFGFVTEGIFREFYTDAEGREYIKAFNFKGDFTGSYYDLYSQKPSLISIQALVYSEALVVPFYKIQDLMDQEVAWLKVVHEICHRLLMKKIEKEYQLLSLDAIQRYDLLKLQNPELEQLVPNYHLASYLGITPVSLSRIRTRKK